MLGDILPDNLLDPWGSTAAAWHYESIRFFSRLAVDLPPKAWWLPLVVLIILGVTALIDAFKARVPDAPIILGLALTAVTLGHYSGWPLAGERLCWGFVAAIVPWGINYLYFLWQRHDAIGMGDAKWTALAAAAFAVKPALWAWVIGACLGMVWLLLSWILSLIHRLFSASAQKDYLTRVHFTPFLFIGLLAGLYWNFLR